MIRDPASKPYNVRYVNQGLSCLADMIPGTMLQSNYHAIEHMLEALECGTKSTTPLAPLVSTPPVINPQDFRPQGDAVLSNWLPDASSMGSMSLDMPFSEVAGMEWNSWPWSNDLDLFLSYDGSNVVAFQQ
jgi:hypothetical protein